MEDKPKMYKNKIDKEFHNNKVVYMSSDKSNDKKTISIEQSSDVRKKINDIINSNSFIYRTRVNIVIGDEVISRKIIGVFNNNLVTIDNEYIPIDNIKDIYK